MKVVQLLPELDAGGVERGTVELARHLASEGHESLVVSNGGRMAEALERGGSRHIRRPIHRKNPVSLAQVPRLRRLFAEEQPDIVHARSRVPAWLTWLAWRRMPAASRPRFVTTVHGFNSVNAYSRIMTAGEAVICVSESVRQHILANYASVPSERLTVVHRGVDRSEYRPEFRPSEAWRQAWFAEFPETRGKRWITLPGRVTRLKGHEAFLRILRDFDAPGVHGIVAGGAHPRKQAYLREIRSLAAELGVADRVTFAGHRSDLKEILSASDAVLSLSQQPESFGRTALEALALGAPVVGYGHGGVGEILAHCFPDGRVPFGDESAVARTLRRQLDAPSPIHADDRFSLERMCEGEAAVYQRLSG